MSAVVEGVPTAAELSNRLRHLDQGRLLPGTEQHRHLIADLRLSALHWMARARGADEVEALSDNPTPATLRAFEQAAADARYLRTLAAAAQSLATALATGSSAYGELCACRLLFVTYPQRVERYRLSDAA
jgi:hypothetical protein